MKAALIVDRDLGLMFWLAEKLGSAGYDTYPAESVTAAQSLLGQLRGGIDLAIVNPTLPQAARLLELLSSCTPPPEILTLEPDPLKSLSELLRQINKQPCHAA